MSKVLIIAEAGVNHNGSIELAKQLVDVAAEAGVDYVKFQTFKAEKLVNKTAAQAEYQTKNTKKTESQFAMLKRLELSHEEFEQLIDHCNHKGVKFLSTAFDLESIEFLKDKLDFYKIPSGEITNLPYLEAVASLNLPIVMSTGMADLNEVEQAYKILIKNGVEAKNLTILHCSTEYPTPMQDVNLKAMLSIGEKLNVQIGYSDHTLGIEIPIAAVAMGAKVIEKHFTLDRTMPGPDHKASLEPQELKNMVQSIRNIELALGDGVKKPSEKEYQNLEVARKSIVAKAAIKAGDVFSENNLTIKRPGTGISPMRWHEIIGTQAAKDYLEDDLI